MTRTSRLPRAATTLVALVALAACGDTSTAPAASDTAAQSGASSAAPVTRSQAGSAETARPSASVMPAAATGTTPSVSVAGCTGTTVVLTADEKRTLDLHNQQRVASGLVQLCVHPALTAAARAHSQDMLARGYFSHTSPNGDTFVIRVVRAGYASWRALAENIAWGSGTYGSPEQIFSGWMNSAGHRANIANGSLREIGIGVAAGTYKGYAGARMYTVDFGTR